MKKLLIATLVLFSFSCNKQNSKTDKKEDSRCSMLPVTGPCQAAIVRYYYDPVDKVCKSFTWGGCGEFPFKTLEECKSCGCNTGK